MPSRSKTPIVPPQTLSIDQAMATAYAHWNAGQAAQAEQLSQRVLAVSPEYPDALHLMGLLAYTHGNRSMAIDYIKRACASPRASAQYFSNLAEMCRQTGRLGEALPAARRAVEIDPRHVAAWNNLGILLQEMGQLDESLECLRRVADLSPDSPESHNNLANTLRRLGQLNEARKHYELAIDLRPNYSEARSNLANLLHEFGDSEAAALAAREAIEFDPRNADAYITAAVIAHSRGQRFEALRWLDNLFAFAPNHAGGMLARARILNESADYAGAERAARTAVAVENGEAYAVLGKILHAQGREAEALAAYDRAIALPMAGKDGPLTDKAALLSRSGRTAEALAACDQALAINPGSADAWRYRADLKRFTAGDPEIAGMEALLAAGEQAGQGLAARIALNFALGKARLDAGDPDRAFVHYAEGNRLKRATFAYEADAIGRWMSSIAECFPAAAMRRLAGTGHGAEAPLFVVGMPCSGTGLLARSLGLNPTLRLAGELKILPEMVEQILSPDGRPAGYPAMAATLLPADIARLGQYYAERARAGAPGQLRIIDELPSNFLYAGLINLILPNARIVRCRRDALDTCLSGYVGLFHDEQKFSYDLSELGLFHRAYDQLMDHWRAVLPADRYIEIDYEALLAAPEDEMRKLTDFCGLAWDEACLEPLRNPSRAEADGVGIGQRHAAHLQPLLAALGIASSAA
jgi:tetratricopeptide (TPR) repeat protein